jgi:hypothetical protein
MAGVAEESNELIYKLMLDIQGEQRALRADIEASFADTRAEQEALNAKVVLLRRPWCRSTNSWTTSPQATGWSPSLSMSTPIALTPWEPASSGSRRSSTSPTHERDRR